MLTLPRKNVEKYRLNVNRNQPNEMVGDKTRVGGNKNKTNPARKKEKSRITGRIKKSSQQ